MVAWFVFRKSEQRAPEWSRSGRRLTTYPGTKFHKVTASTSLRLSYSQHRFDRVAAFDIGGGFFHLTEVIELLESVEWKLPCSIKPDKFRDKALRNGIALNDAWNFPAFRQRVCDAAMERYRKARKFGNFLRMGGRGKGLYLNSLLPQSRWGPQPNITGDLVAPHKDLGRARWFYAQQANLYRRGKSASFSIPRPVTAPNLRAGRRN